MNSRTIARNTLWYGLESFISYAASFITSIAVARTLGPSRMGYIVYVTWIVTITSSLGSVGIPATTRKYMAEFLGAQNFATARFIYLRTLGLQTIISGIATVLAGAWVLHTAPAEYRLAAMLLVISIWPAMVNFISAQANVATENLSANVPASAASSAVFFVFTATAIFLHWGVVGITAAMLLMRVVDFAVRFFPTFKRILAWPHAAEGIPPELRRSMFRFAGQSLTGMLLTLVVWDRSELFLLKSLSPDIRQIAFYSVALGIAERLLIFPSIFAAATGASIFAQFGRDRSRLPAMTAASARYLALSSVPVHMIATALVGPTLLTLYGEQYRGAVLVATWAPLLCLPKALLGPIQTLFESTDAQKFFLISTVVASFIDIGVAWALIPSLGAMGACLGSGAAQFAAVGAMWAIGVRRYRIELPWAFFCRLGAISGITALLTYLVVARFSTLTGLFLGTLTALICFFSLAFLFKLLEAEDVKRLQAISGSLPQAVAGPVNHLFASFSRRLEAESATN